MAFSASKRQRFSLQETPPRQRDVESIPPLAFLVFNSFIFALPTRLVSGPATFAQGVGSAIIRDSRAPSALTMAYLVPAMLEPLVFASFFTRDYAMLI